VKEPTVFPAELVAQKRAFNKFYRVAMLQTLFDSLTLSLNATNRRTTLNLKNARPNHALVMQASEHLRDWTALSTNTTTVIANWQYLDTNALSYPNRFYRAVSQGK
jgi:hypothetical protein